MIVNGYQVICFEHGARPAAEVFNSYSCYAYDAFLDSIMQGIIARKADVIFDEYRLAEKLLIFDIQEAAGRPETMKIINELIRARCKQHSHTVLIGEYIPPQILIDIEDDVIFISDGAEHQNCAIETKGLCTNEL